VVEDEYGIIPMTNVKFVRSVGRIVNIGTAGGQTKASSGYTFKFIQKQAEAIAAALLRNGNPVIPETFAGKRFNLYDSTLLNILHNNKLGGDKIFADLFSKNDPERVLRFLDNESSLEDEINIMGSVPSGIFMKAAFQEIFR
jgi:lycopene beta-cyclase